MPQLEQTKPILDLQQMITSGRLAAKSLTLIKNKAKLSLEESESLVTISNILNTQSVNTDPIIPDSKLLSNSVLSPIAIERFKENIIKYLIYILDHVNYVIKEQTKIFYKIQCNQQHLFPEDEHCKEDGQVVELKKYLDTCESNIELIITLSKTIDNEPKNELKEKILNVAMHEVFGYGISKEAVEYDISRNLTICKKSFETILTMLDSFNDVFKIDEIGPWMSTLNDKPFSDVVTETQNVKVKLTERYNQVVADLKAIYINNPDNTILLNGFDNVGMNVISLFENHALAISNLRRDTNTNYINPDEVKVYDILNFSVPILDTNNFILKSNSVDDVNSNNWNLIINQFSYLSSSLINNSSMCKTIVENYYNSNKDIMLADPDATSSMIIAFIDIQDLYKDLLAILSALLLSFVQTVNELNKHINLVNSGLTNIWYKLK